jgi:predicted DNA-binding transcriptional regulator AlpA
MVVHRERSNGALRRWTFCCPASDSTKRVAEMTKAKTSPKARVRHQPNFLLLDRRALHIANLGIGADPELLIDTKQVAEWLGVSVQWAEIGRSRGYGPPYKKLGRKSIRYRVGDILIWLEDRSHKSTADYAAGQV